MAKAALTKGCAGLSVLIAVDLLRMAREHFDASRSGADHTFAHRLVLSSIIHAFSGLESAINFLGFDLFHNTDSERYIPPEQRDFLINRLVRPWDIIPCIEKLSFILSHSSKVELPAKLENQLRELNNLRNWIVHGFSYKTTLLVEPTEQGYYNIVDTEDSVDWAKKFPNTKFKPLDKLEAEDADLAHSIVFQVLRVLSDCMFQPFAVITCVPDFDYRIVFQEEIEIKEIIVKDVRDP